MQQTEKIWFITGTSKGFGRIWARAALERGDKVVATARNTDALAELVSEYADAGDRRALRLTVARTYRQDRARGRCRVPSG